MGIDIEVFIDEHKISKQFICAICQVQKFVLVFIQKIISLVVI